MNRLSVMRIIAVAFAALLATARGSLAAAGIVSVSDVEQLYAAVNDSHHAGATIILAPGYYTLTKVDPLGGSRPNGGRLELQANMSMTGVAGHPEDVVIDSSDPTNGPTFPLGSGLGNAGTIRIGRGLNSVQWLTVIGGAGSAAGVQTDLNGGVAVLRIEHVVSRDSVRGIDVRNLGPDGASRRLVVDLGDNEVFNNTASNGQGIRFVNTNADGASIVATLHGNRSHHNNAGFLASNQGSSHASITVQSLNDHFDDNLVGGVILGGLTTTVGTIANNSAVTFAMVGGSITGSHGTLQPLGVMAGLNVVGGSYSVPAAAGSASQNSVQMTLSGSLFENNAAFDVEAWGAKAPAGLPLAGTGNAVTIVMAGARATTHTTASVPDEPAGTNHVTLVQ